MVQFSLRYLNFYIAFKNYQTIVYYRNVQIIIILSKLHNSNNCVYKYYFSVNI